jgi:hypothetical protein
MGVSLTYGFKHYVWFHCQFIINLIVKFSFPEKVKSFEHIHHPTFISYVESFHNTPHWADRVPVIQEVHGEFGFSVAIFKVVEVFVETDFERSPCLTNIFHFAHGACQLIDSTVLVFISGTLMLCC